MPPTSATRAPELGLRERKKQRTRELIAETARRLFAARGFERVTIAEVAREADVSEQTVFNYFPTKEDLVYWRFEGFEDELLTAIRRRDCGESVLRAFGRFVLRRRGLRGASGRSPPSRTDSARSASADARAPVRRPREADRATTQPRPRCRRRVPGPCSPARTCWR